MFFLGIWACPLFIRKWFLLALLIKDKGQVYWKKHTETPHITPWCPAKKLNFIIRLLTKVCSFYLLLFGSRCPILRSLYTWSSTLSPELGKNLERENCLEYLFWGYILTWFPTNRNQKQRGGPRGSFPGILLLQQFHDVKRKRTSELKSARGSECRGHGSKIYFWSICKHKRTNK